jgi:hypothetical protein
MEEDDDVPLLVTKIRDTYADSLMTSLVGGTFQGCIVTLVNARFFIYMGMRFLVLTRKEVCTKFLCQRAADRTRQFLRGVGSRAPDIELERLEICLQHVDIDGKCHSGMTLLAKAVVAGDVALVELLLNHSADKTSGILENGETFSLLRYAAMRVSEPEYAAIVQALVAGDAPASEFHAYLVARITIGAALLRGGVIELEDVMDPSDSLEIARFWKLVMQLPSELVWDVATQAAMNDPRMKGVERTENAELVKLVKTIADGIQKALLDKASLRDALNARKAAEMVGVQVNDAFLEAEKEYENFDVNKRLRELDDYSPAISTKRARRAY